MGAIQENEESDKQCYQISEKHYYSEKLEKLKSNPRETWKLINELSSRNSNKTSVVFELKIDGQTVTSSHEIADKLRI